MKHRKLYGFLALILVLAITLVLILVPSCRKPAEGDTAEGGPVTDPTAFSYSTGLDENGFWEGVKAQDCVTPVDYQKITIPSATHTISAERVQTEIETLLTQYSTPKEIKDRPVKDGDTVNIDYVGRVGGVEFEGGNTNGGGAEVTIGVTEYIDDFLAQLVGHKPGDTFDVNVTFPAEYGVEELNGKDAVFATTINHIVETEKPELTDTFVAENFAAGKGWTTVAQLKESISADLQKIAIEQYLVDYLLDNSEVKSIPKQIVECQEAMMTNYYEQAATYNQVQLEEYLSANEGVTSLEELKAAKRADNEKESTYLLIMQAIAEKEGIRVGEDDLKTYFAGQFNAEDYTQYEDQYGLPYLKMTVLSHVVTERIKSTLVMG